LTLVVVLVLISTLGNGLLAGAGMDYMIKQLPARHTIGIIAYAKYFKASDLANGRFWYIPLGISMYIFNIGTAVATAFTNEGQLVSLLIYVASLFAIIHLVGTTRAAPKGLSVRQIPPDDALRLTRVFDKFSRWSYVRGVAGVFMFGAMLCAIMVIT
jgi:hypothetical protein